jgi:hypothetical protein
MIDPIFSSPDELAKFVIKSNMPLDVIETRFIQRMVGEQRIINGEKTSVMDLHELRILFWQAVGYSKKSP